MSCHLTVERKVGPIFIRPSGVLSRGHVVPGHRHHFDHTTILFSGAVVVRETRPDGSTAEHAHAAPDDWATPKDAVHEVTATEDGTVFYCVYPHRLPDGTVTEGYDGFDPAYAAVPPFPGTE